MDKDFITGAVFALTTGVAMVIGLLVGLWIGGTP